MFRSHAGHRPATLRALALALTICSGLSAQTASISPKGAAFDGGSNFVAPYSWYPSRYQQIYDHDSFSHGSGVLRISEIAYRLTKPRRKNTAARDAEVTIHLAYAAQGVDSTNTGLLFDANVDLGTKKLCVARRTVRMPSIGNESFGFVIKFDSSVSFVYDPSKKRSLVLEVLKWDAYRPGYLIDAAYGQKARGTSISFADQDHPKDGWVRPVARSGQCRPFVAATQEVRATQWRLSTWFQPRRSAVAFFILGERVVDVPLPPSQCNLRVPPRLILPAERDANGYHVAYLTQPDVWDLERFFVQAAAIIETTRGFELGGAIECIPFNKLNGPLPPDRLTSIGWQGRNRGQVTAFR